MTVLDRNADLAKTAAPLAAGFADPVHDAQRCFRTIMNAMARPGTLQAIETGGLKPPAPLTPVAAAIALTLVDYDTPVWLDGPFARSEAVKTFLRFHTGAPIVSEPVEAAFRADRRSGPSEQPWQVSSGHAGISGPFDHPYPDRPDAGERGAHHPSPVRASKPRRLFRQGPYRPPSGTR